MPLVAASLGSLSGSADRALILLIAVLILALLTGIAYHWPTATMVLFLVLGPLSYVLHMTAVGSPMRSITVAAVRPVDAVLVAMLGASAWRTLALARTRRATFPASLRWTAAALGLWLLIEIVRNAALYGLSAPGEFRFLYLVLAMPVYVALSFTKPDQRRRLFTATVLAATVVTLCFVPIIGLLNGWRWGIGPDSRLLPALLSLGLVLGWLALFLAARVSAIRISMALVWLLALPVGALVLTDGHRSVWLALLAGLLALVVMREVSPMRISGWSVPVAAAAGLILMLVLAAGFNPAPYVAGRAKAFTAPSEDANASWREAQWKAQLAVWRESMLAGEGFGNYWTTGQKYGGAGIAPHSLYMEALTKMGLVGLALWLGTAASVAMLLARTLMRLRREGRRRDLDYVLVVTGLLGLVAVHVYGVAYALDYYALLFVGLGVAAAAHGSPAATPRADHVEPDQLDLGSQ